MATKRYERCVIWDIRVLMADELDLLPEDESAEEFWERVEKTGRLVEALAIYDRLEAEEAAKVRRETKQEFMLRVEREGRAEEAERIRAELLASGLSNREAQVKLVKRLQPLDGSKTRAWETPDPWNGGRLFLRKADQERVLSLTSGEDEEDREATDAQERLNWAITRQQERQALARARQRAQALKTAAVAATAK
jgi:hypothetical protein